MEGNTGLAAGETAAQEEKSREIARFTKKKPKKKIALIAAAVLIAGAVAVQQLMPKDTSVLVDTAAVSKGELSRRINLSGTVTSDSSARIYSNESGLVKSVLVKVGDKVQEGDLLCELDTLDIERSLVIKQQEMQLGLKKAELNLETSSKQYQDLYDDLQKDNYSALITAQQALNYAQRDYADAKRDLNKHEDEQDYADDVINKLEREMSLARIALSRAKKAYNDAVKSGGDTSAAYTAMQEADMAYADAFAKWEDANDEYGDDVTKYTKAFREARLKYNDALEDKELAERSATRNLEALKNAMEIDELNLDMTAERMELERLQQSLMDSSVKSPISGTITAVYALEGMPGSGLLFVIENTDELIVKTAVREYDVGSISTGMPAIIKSDATGEKEFDGNVLRIAPAAEKDENGSTKTDTSKAVEFGADISLKNPDDAIRIGMNVRLNVILEQKNDALYVPYDSVTQNEAGESLVYVARQDEEGNYKAAAVPVTLGMETDFYIEVFSEELREGELIILTPASVFPEAPVKLSSDSVEV